MVKHTQTIRQLLSRKFLSVFDHFVGLAFQGLTLIINSTTILLVPIQDGYYMLSRK